MSITFLGYIFIPSTILIWAKKPSWLLYLAIFFAIFQGSCVISIESNQTYITPYYFALTVISLSAFYNFIVDLSLKKKIITSTIKYLHKFNLFLNFFVLYSMFSLLFVFLFEGLEVYVPREGLDAGNSILTWKISNLAQIVYLIENIIFFKALCQNNIHVQLDICKKVIKFTGAVTILIGFWHVWGYAYPSGILTSPIFEVGHLQTSVIGTKRLASTFPEPSYAAAFLAPFVMMMIIEFSRKYNFTNTVLLLCSATGLFLTFSTTGFLSFITIIILLIILNNKKIILNNKKIILVITCLLFIFSLISIVILSNLETLSKIIIFFTSKSNSDSGLVRGGADTHAFELLIQSYGLGVGIGSNRPSSFLTWLCSNLGICGLIFLGYCVIVPVKKYLKDKNDFFWVHFTSLLAMIIAIPELSYPFLWIFMALSLKSELRKNPVSSY